MKNSKIRAWDAKSEEMFYVNDLYFFEEEGIHDFKGDGHHITYELMFSIGMKDKNNSDIYDGDLFYWRDSLRQVVYREDKASYMAKRISGYQYNDRYFYMWNLQNQLEFVEIIGNVYENKDLLK